MKNTTASAAPPRVVRPLTAKAVRSIRAVAHMNLRQARVAKQAGYLRLYAWHLSVALDCRHDANSLF
jgi:hypothetical protein